MCIRELSLSSRSYRLHSAFPPATTCQLHPSLMLFGLTISVLLTLSRAMMDHCQWRFDDCLQVGPTWAMQCNVKLLLLTRNLENCGRRPMSKTVFLDSEEGAEFDDKCNIFKSCHIKPVWCRWDHWSTPRGQCYPTQTVRRERLLCCHPTTKRRDHRVRCDVHKKVQTRSVPGQPCDKESSLSNNREFFRDITVGCFCVFIVLIGLFISCRCCRRLKRLSGRRTPQASGARPAVTSQRPPASGARPAVTSQRPPASTGPAVTSQRQSASTGPAVTSQRQPASTGPTVTPQRQPASAVRPAVTSQRPPASTEPTVTPLRPPASTGPTVTSQGQISTRPIPAIMPRAPLRPPETAEPQYGGRVIRRTEQPPDMQDAPPAYRETDPLVNPPTLQNEPQPPSYEMVHYEFPSPPPPRYESASNDRITAPPPRYESVNNDPVSSPPGYETAITLVP